jgi:hypothetical protein
MTLLRYFLGGKTQSGEDRIGGGTIGFSLDPILHPRQTLGGLMDVVAIREVGERFEQLLETFGAAEEGRSRHIAGPASRRARRWPHSLVLTHLSAFPLGCSARTQSPSVAG